MFAQTVQLDKIVDLTKELVKNQIKDAFPELGVKDLAKVYEQWEVYAPEGDYPSQYDCQIYTGKAAWKQECQEWGIGQVEPIVWAKVKGGYAFIG